MRAYSARPLFGARSDFNNGLLFTRTLTLCAEHENFGFWVTAFSNLIEKQVYFSKYVDLCPDPTADNR